MEPNPLLFDKLKSEYRECSNLIFENVAISKYDGIANFYYFKDTIGIPEWANQVGALSREHLLSVAKANDFLKEAKNKIACKELQVLNFMSLINKYFVNSIEFLQEMQRVKILTF